MEKIGMGETSMDKTNQFLKSETGKESSLATSGAAVGTLFGGPLGTLGGFVAGGLISHIAGRLKGGAEGRETDAKNELEYHNRAHDSNKTVSEDNQVKADSFRQKAKEAADSGDMHSAAQFSKQANDHQKLANTYGNIAKDHKSKGEAASRSANFNKKMKNFLGSTQAFTSETTQKAAAKGSEDINTARDRVKVLANNKTAMVGKDGFDNSTFYSASGQTSGQKKFFNQLTAKDNTDSQKAIKNLEEWVRGINVNDPKEMARLIALTKGTAAFSKGGNDTGSLATLISLMDSKNALNTKPTKVGSVASLKDSVIANRNTGVTGEQGSGAFHYNTFANNASGEEGKNVIGVDFNKLSGAGLDVNAEASFASGASMAPIVEALKAQINNERASLNELRSTGAISDSDFTKKQSDLGRAEARLNDPNQVNDLQLVNTASANYGRQERMTSKYHEEIHAGGVEDEDLTERTAQSLMNNKLYGRNAATSGRHATEVAGFAQNLKNQGMNNDDIMREVDKEIQLRLQSEGKNRAERVIKIMSGEKETVTQAVSGLSGGSASLDTSELQKSMEDLAAKFEKVGESFKGFGGRQSGSGGREVAAYLKKITQEMKANNVTLKKIKTLSGGKKPSTVIEGAAITDVVSDN